jgi:hypothetical protein
MRRIFLKLVTTTRPVLQGLVMGLFVAMLLIAADQLSIRLGLSQSWRIVDDTLGGVITGLLVFLYSRIRLRYVEERLNTVALMNHHIRNALQVITHAQYIQPPSRQFAEVQNAIQRIDWTLREILPGRITGYEEGWHTEDYQVRPKEPGPDN